MNIRRVLPLLLMALVGCENLEDYRLFPDAYVTNTEFDSIYYYGYNQGCESALSQLEMLDYEYLKDDTLAGEAKFNAGWENGYKACKDGVRQVMFTLPKTANQ